MARRSSLSHARQNRRKPTGRRIAHQLLFASPCESCEVNPATYTILGHHRKTGRPTYEHICHECRFGG